jgi:crotonobetainyl-CoA:carnitine CoA-transferase CaiB-like acyl-CoA transferase
MVDAALSFMSVRLAPALGAGRTKRQDIIRRGAYDIYRTKDGRFITLGVIEDKFWQNLARALGRVDLAQDPRFATDRLRNENRAAVREILEGILPGRDLESWVALFSREDVPAAPVNWMEEIASDPQVRHRGLIFGLEDDAGRECKQVGYPGLFPSLPGREDAPAPAMGRDGREILRGLGWDEEKIESFVREGVVHIPPEFPGRDAP